AVGTSFDYLLVGPVVAIADAQETVTRSVRPVSNGLREPPGEGVPVDRDVGMFGRRCFRPFDGRRKLQAGVQNLPRRSANNELPRCASRTSKRKRPWLCGSASISPPPPTSS